MAWPCNFKSQKLVINPNDSIYNKCNIKLEYPPITNFNYPQPGSKLPPKERNLRLNNPNHFSQNSMAKKKLKFQCHYEERKRRAELRRKKIIQKLKKVYEIDVEGLNEHLTRDIILKTEIMEREKKEREKRKIEKSVLMISKLLDEQRYKTRDSKVCHPLRRKAVKNVIHADKEEKLDSKIRFSEMSEEGDTPSQKVIRGRESLTKEIVNLPSKDSKLILLGEDGEKSIEEEEPAPLPKCTQTEKVEEVPRIYVPEKSKSKPKPLLEKCLECTPRKIVFENYEKNKVYLQVVKITNISCDTIHCRYLGIVVHTKTEEKFPIGVHNLKYNILFVALELVRRDTCKKNDPIWNRNDLLYFYFEMVAVRDSVKLRPGLSCSTKIRLCSQDDTKTLECSVIYETRRPKVLSQHCWFTVPVVCVPIQSIVKVSPLKITFPTLSWCEAMDLDGGKRSSKTLKIENSGAKACCCKISDTRLAGDDGDKESEEETEGEYPNYEPNLLIDIKSENQKLSSENGSEEFYGEYSFLPDKAENLAKLILNEILKSVQAPFRFSQKFYIEIPAYSTVYIQVTFIPQYRGFHYETYYIQFEGCDNCTEQPILLYGDIIKLPLRTEPQVIHFNTCIANSGAYSATFKVFNDGKGPCWVVLKLPAAVKNHAHVCPRTTVILPFSFTVFSVKIYPRVTLARDAPRYYSEESQILDFPIFIHPANVGSCWKDYIKIYVLALITDYCLQLSPPEINLGTVSTLETVRTQLQLTNHSLAALEYGFLNLPRGVRVEPNMGFGTILPKETIILYLLYSPEEGFLGHDENLKQDQFQITVTSIAEYGGFREKLEVTEDSFKSITSIWGEDQALRLSPIVSEQTFDNHETEDFDECEESSSVEGEELCLKLYQQENKIREFLKQDPDEESVASLPNVLSSQGNQPEKTSATQLLEENTSGEFEENDPRGIFYCKKHLQIVNCHAIVVKPRCRLSGTVIQLPATPYSSFSLFRLRLYCTSENNDEGECTCGFRKNPKKSEDKSKLRTLFQFQYECPHVTFEPASGCIRPGKCIPITIIYRPVLPPRPEIKKEEKSMLEVKNEREISPQSTSGVKQSKTKQNKISDSSIENVMSAASQGLKSVDYLSGEKALEKLPDPFVVQTRVRCIVKTVGDSDVNERAEIHEMVLICPVVTPTFIYLGKSREIKFDKRISPSATLLNPVGSFYCPIGVRRVELDPEHVWRQPLTYAPLSARGVERQFFEIYCGSTNIFLTVSGEGVQPDCRISPNFACCVVDVKQGSKEELRLDLENLSLVTLKLSMQTNFLKSIPDFGSGENDVEDEAKTKKEESKDRRRSKKSGNQNLKFLDEIPEMISSSVENSDDLDVDGGLNIFSLTGLNDNNEFTIPPSGRCQIKILINPPPEADGVYATQYALKLEKTSLLKEMLVIAKILNGK